MEKQNLKNLRHSCAHLLAAAVMKLWPDTKRTIGPAIDNGFYFDFEFSHPVSEADLPKIEQKMHEIAKRWDKFVRHELPTEEAKNEYPDNPYKHELIDEIAKKGEKISFYKSGDYWDLCEGGHVDNPKEQLKYFKLISIAGAYWRGNEKNKMLTRIYGTAYPSKEELDKYLWQLTEAKKRDHRKLGQALELFTISPQVGQGLTLWLPKGAIVRREIEDYMVREQTKLGFQHVYSPHIGLKSLWERSGHWDLYRDKMYTPMEVEDNEFLVKPMTCPMHIQSYLFKPRSYRDLPFRIAEIAAVYRYEKSGELNGLLRVRAFTQDDAHIFCTEEQAVTEFLSVFNFIQRLYKVFGFDNYRVRLGVRSKKEKYLGSDELWERAQKKAIDALEKSGSQYSVSEGDAAFYGPKADFLIKDALGREWQCGTVQIDFMLPERFGLKYIGPDGQEKTPVMIHRAPLGSLERFLAILIENYTGAFPIWLSPVQVTILPVSDKFIGYSQRVLAELNNHNIRAEINNDNLTLGKKIRQSTLQKIPYMVIIGEKEAQSKDKIALRTREGKDLGQVSINEFLKKIKDQIENHS